MIPLLIRHKNYLFVLISLLITTKLYNQEPKNELQFQHLKKELTQSSITKIFEDSYGFLWIGTQKGLHKYDGTNYETFEQSKDATIGLSNSDVGHIIECKNGDLLIGSRQGLNKYDRLLNNIQPFQFKEEAENLSTKNIYHIFEDRHLLFLGTYESGLFKYNKITGETQHLNFATGAYSQMSYNFILSTERLNENTLVVFTQAAIYLVDNNLNIIKKSNEGQYAKSVKKVDDENFIIGTNDGLISFVTITKNNEINISKKKITKGYALLSLELDDYQNLWIGSENDGLYIYSSKTDTLKNYKVDPTLKKSIKSNSIWSIHKGSKGVMWLGLFKKGLNFYDNDYHNFDLITSNRVNSNSLSNDVVNCFYEDEKGNLWIGTDGGGLNYWNRTENTFKHYALNNGTLNSNAILALLNDNKDQLWVGTWAHGIAIFAPDKKSYRVLNTENSFLLSNNVTDLKQDKKGRIWIVTLFGGLQVYDPQTKAHENIELKENSTSNIIYTGHVLEEDSEGNIWVGTQSAGVFKISENEEIDKWSTKRYHKFDEQAILSNNFVHTITKDNEGIIWVGTQSGLNKYVPEIDNFKIITQNEGLKNDVIKGILTDDENLLWLSTVKGILRYKPKDSSCILYNTSDGLQGDEFIKNSFYRTKKGEFLFGGSNGFNIFNPKNIKISTESPQVIIRNFKVFNETVTPNDQRKLISKDISNIDTLTLTHRDAVIDFEYAALTFKHPEKIEYAYFLDGFEKEWNYVGSKRNATYTNLNPGQYALRIKSTNEDGVWSDQQKTLHITVIPPFWKTWWFTFLGLATLSLLIYCTYMLRVRNIEKNQIKLEKEINIRTKELQEQKNKLIEVADELSTKNEEIQRFTFAVSHDLKSPISSIKGLASIIPMDIEMENYPDLEKYLKMINISCDTMTELIADITKIAKLGKIENINEPLDTNEIINYAKTLLGGKLNINNIQLSVAEKLPLIYADRKRMIQVFENLLDNAIKYMGDQENPEIRIEAEEEIKWVQLKVIDNGAGLNSDSLQKLFSPFERFHPETEGTGLGLFTIKKIVESHGGSIICASEGPGKGATFTVRLKKSV